MAFAHAVSALKNPLTLTHTQIPTYMQPTLTSHLSSNVTAQRSNRAAFWNVAGPGPLILCVIRYTICDLKRRIKKLKMGQGKESRG